ncbi:GNAT family N-acetyltransferase [Paenibacillus antibioticophila]|uniref:GNAT family N-acetyltransferase n=1 Tax=Paenibacillus antibioticophila TaxID=1274374 RepID=UPI0005C9371B|nr:GNAT family N-acetyltransferase [Paenibacillus antibioticophila]
MYLHRKLETRDIEAICTFPQSEEELLFMSPRFVYPLTSDQIIGLAKDRFEPTVIIDKQTKKVVAYANIYKDEDGFWLGNVVVSPGYRGQGASQYLIQVMMDKAKNLLKLEQLKLVCHNTNSRGLAFYSKLGFKPYDVKNVFNGQTKLITILMSKELH